MCNNNTATNLIGGAGSAGQVILTYSVNAADPLAASFSASPTNGGAPLTVTFTDTSTGTIANRFWNFGDGATVNVTTTGLTHTYSFPGTNTVTLIVSDASGSSTNTKAGLIVATSVDTVGDGAPDWWRAQYFGGNGTTTNGFSSATVDFDNDGVNNLGEYNADTNPTNSASRLAVTSLTIVSNQARLIWTGGSSAWQFVEYRNSLTDTNGWKAVYTNTPPTAVTNTVFDAGAGSATSRFYRIKAWR
jgi:PKD repeat protein